VGLALATPEVRADALVRYSFDDDRVETGPETFGVFEHARGRVLLDSTYRVSGHFSVRVQDVAGDGDFPELQGYFARRDRGKLHVHFALLVADPRETLNVGLAGPRGFGLVRDGLAFWLETRAGMLVHVSGGVARELIRLEPFVWYQFDLAYDVERGRYDLAIREEGRRAPLVQARNQPSATGQPGSVVDKFSFIGDRGGDRSNVAYWVDDVAIDVDEPYEAEPFVAPGRRQLFFESWYEAEARLRTRPRCLPLVEPADLGMDRLEARRLQVDGRLDVLLGLATGEKQLAELGFDHGIVDATALWSRGCAALDEARPDEALRLFESALERAPRAPLFALSAALAEASLATVARAAAAPEDWDAVDRRLEPLYASLAGDARLDAALGTIGIARGDLDEAERWLAGAAHDPARAGHAHPADGYYFVLLSAERFEDAERFARSRARETQSALWSERAADAMVFAGDFEDALVAYRALDAHHGARSSTLKKLSDVSFALGDTEGERRYRERIYGTLFEE
jgi:Tfp pilus assembly protein PilF